jgi:hypothetical protein
MIMGLALVRDSAFNSRALKVPLAVQALEHSKDLIGMLGVEAHSVITNKKRGCPVEFPRIYFNFSDLAAAREFHGIGEKIKED